MEGLLQELDNERLSNKMDIDMHEIMSAASTKPFGFKAFYPGPGLGGHCIPIDPFILTWKAKKHGLNTKFIELSGKINESITEQIITIQSYLAEDCIGDYIFSARISQINKSNPHDRNGNAAIYGILNWTF